ncbi:MAG: hypothetical protein JXB07_18820 [Anaerolineae bacterium]|nr:hypothetical protein [Anaerolineae bacterium]
MTSKTTQLSDKTLIELVIFGIGLLVCRGLATLGDVQDLKALLDELPAASSLEKAA